MRKQNVPFIFQSLRLGQMLIKSKLMALCSYTVSL
uniref:Uncharacterized protein n=1 Tax=Anguilla anguilla TaxID=7936 RepID=A0A0E9TH37_ANGAN